MDPEHVSIIYWLIVLTLLWSRLLLLHLLDEQVKHLCLDEVLDKVPGFFRLNGLVETSLFKQPTLCVMTVFNI